jgi:hypothetical protein
MFTAGPLDVRRIRLRLLLGSFDRAKAKAAYHAYWHAAECLVSARDRNTGLIEAVVRARESRFFATNFGSHFPHQIDVRLFRRFVKNRVGGRHAIGEDEFAWLRTVFHALSGLDFDLQFDHDLRVTTAALNGRIDLPFSPPPNYRLEPDERILARMDATLHKAERHERGEAANVDVGMKRGLMGWGHRWTTSRTATRVGPLGPYVDGELLITNLDCRCTLST